MKRITVYTTTYNRAHTLVKGYNALCRQTCNYFIWLIIDDGSTDNTKELVQKWINDGKIDIRYIYQDNKGVNVARNKAIENINTELNICVDSDDYLSDSAIEDILKFWDQRKDDKYVGIIALDCYSSGQIVGKPFPINLKESTLFNLYEKLGIVGDKKMIYKTEACKKYPCPSYIGEKYYPNRHKYYLLDKEGPCLLLHKPICIVEYLNDGITASRFKRYINNPIGFTAYREFLIDNNPTLINICRQSIHLIAMKLVAGKNIRIKKNQWSIILFLMIPFGLAFYFYILFKVK